MRTARLALKISLDSKAVLTAAAEDGKRVELGRVPPLYGVGFKRIVTAVAGVVFVTAFKQKGDIIQVAVVVSASGRP
jgi:hypothetical protein